MSAIRSLSSLRSDASASGSGRREPSGVRFACGRHGHSWCTPWTTSHRRTGKKRLLLKVLASAEATDTPTFDGMFGKWTLEKEDRREVLTYRGSLTVAAAMFALDALIILLPADNQLHEAFRGVQNAVAATGAASLGLGLYLIHIYVTPIKRTIQLLWALGFVGMLYLMGSQGVPVTEYVAAHREAVWLIGPLGASITALGIKEGLCYGTPAALGICLITPILCLGHLTGVMPAVGTEGLLCVLVALAVVFAAGKYKQPIEGDIGDKSVFEFQKLPKEEQEMKLADMNRRNEAN